MLLHLTAGHELVTKNDMCCDGCFAWQCIGINDCYFNPASAPSDRVQSVQCVFAAWHVYCSCSLYILLLMLMKFSKVLGKDTRALKGKISLNALILTLTHTHT